MNISIQSQDTSILSICDKKDTISLNNITFKNVCNIKYDEKEGECTFDCDGGSCTWKVPTKPDALFPKEEIHIGQQHGIFKYKCGNGHTSVYAIIVYDNNTYMLTERLRLISISKSSDGKGQTYVLEDSTRRFFLFFSHLLSSWDHDFMLDNTVSFVSKSAYVQNYFGNNLVIYDSNSDYVILRNSQTEKYFGSYYIFQKEHYDEMLEKYENVKYANDSILSYGTTNDGLTFLYGGALVKFDISDLVFICCKYNENTVSLDILKDEKITQHKITHLSKEKIDGLISFLCDKRFGADYAYSTFVNNEKHLYVKTHPNNWMFFEKDDKKYNVDVVGMDEKTKEPTKVTIYHDSTLVCNVFAHTRSAKSNEANKANESDIPSYNIMTKALCDSFISRQKYLGEDEEDFD